jgi:tRNA C32,U32 (ribose-2'-O)-methylase TrmJ
MNVIAKWLRKKAEDNLDPGNALMREAAAEIDRLTAEMDQRMAAYAEYQERDEAEIERLLKKNIELRQQAECDQREIERLRTALREIKTKCGDPRIVSDIVDAALEPKP